MSKNFKKKSKFAAVVAVLFSMVLSVGAGVIGAYGMTNSPSIQDEVVEPCPVFTDPSNPSFWERLLGIINSIETPETEISAMDALMIAVNHAGTSGRTQTDMTRLVKEEGTGRFAWSVSIHVHDTGNRYEFYIDAQTGYVIRSNIATLASEIITEQPLDCLRSAGDEMRATFPYRFPDAPVTGFNDVNFNGSWDTIGGNLEVNLLNADLRIVLVDAGIAERNRWNSSPNDYRRVFMESSDRSTAYSIMRSGNSTARDVFIWDNNEAHESIVTLFIPTGAGQVFNQANINLENGNLIIDATAQGLLAENLNISVVNGVIFAYETQQPAQYPSEVSITFENINMEEHAALTNIHELDFRAAYLRAISEYTGYDISTWEEALAWLFDGMERHGGLLLSTNAPIRDFELFGINHVFDGYSGESSLHANLIYYQLDELMPERPLFMDMFFATGGFFPSIGISFTDTSGERHSFALVENRIDSNPPFFLQTFQDGEIIGGGN